MPRRSQQLSGYLGLLTAVTFRLTLRLTILGLAAALAFACAPAPSSRKPQKEPVVLRTAAHDRKAGADVAKTVADEMGIVDDPKLKSYVNQIGQRLARQAPGAGFDYTFHIVDQQAPNAFALPGGFIYVSRGLLMLANSEDQLAGVLGHEIIHVARRHAAARQSVVQGIPGPFLLFSGARIAAYSRDQEREADRLGQELAARAGYDPAALGEFLNNLNYTERLQFGMSLLPHFMDTHPATSERVASAGGRAEAISWQPEPGIAPDANAYLRMLEGLVVGMPASEGVFDGDRFLHPALGFSMRFPQGWETINTRAAVGAISPRRDAQVYMQFQGKGDDPQAAAEEYLAEVSEEGFRVQSTQPLRIGDLPAFRAEGRATGVSVHLTWIAREGSILRCTGVAVGVTPDRLAGVFRSVARSLRPLTPRERASIRETHLHLVAAQEGEDLAALSQRTGNEWNLQETAVANGIFANAKLDPGKLVKIALSNPYRPAAAAGTLREALARASMGRLVMPTMPIAVDGSWRKCSETLLPCQRYSSVSRASFEPGP